MGDRSYQVDRVKDTLTDTDVHFYWINLYRCADQPLECEVIFVNKVNKSSNLPLTTTAHKIQIPQGRNSKLFDETIFNDLAVVTLETKMTDVVPIQLPEITAEYFFIEDKVVIEGFGDLIHHVDVFQLQNGQNCAVDRLIKMIKTESFEWTDKQWNHYLKLLKQAKTGHYSKYPYFCSEYSGTQVSL